MKDKAKKKPAYILGSDSKMVAMRLPATTREQLDALSAAAGKSKTLIVVEAVDAFVIRDRILTEHDKRMAGGAE